MFRKKGQEEMVGFALIIIIVAIIALVLLVIANKKPVPADESRELANFLNSMAYYTTNCSSSPEHSYNLKELIRACSQDEKCLNGLVACDVMNRTFVSMLQESFPRESSVKSYYLDIDYNATSVRSIFSLGNLSCPGKKMGAEFFYPANPGVITIMLQGCYS